MSALLERHHELLRECWRAHGGREVKTEGDAFFVAFADTTAAIEACVAAQRALGGRGVAARRGCTGPHGSSCGLRIPATMTTWRMRCIKRRESWRRDMADKCSCRVTLRPPSAGRARARLRSLGRYRLRDFDEPVELFEAGPS